MNEILNVLYQSDDNYAPQTGVSMTSLCINNKELPEINFFVLDDGISEENKARMAEIAREHERPLTFVDTASIKKRLIELGVNPYKGSYTTYYKLFGISEIPTENGLLLQIDGDTIINSSLRGLFDLEFDEDTIIAACYDCVANSYKGLIGISPEDSYYNCGVLWIDQKNWKKFRCEQQIIHHLRNVRNAYFTVDQDIINTLFRSHIKVMSPRFNLNSGFYLYGVKYSFYIYDLAEPYYYSQQEIMDAMTTPIIDHCMGAMSGRPWEQRSFHPMNESYEHYRSLSPWKDVPLILVKRSLIFRIQKALYRILPKYLYAFLHKYAVKRYLKAANKDLLAASSLAGDNDA